ncbi:MAG: DUF3179 domain-containing protein [Alphaproteobacteria bacterium]|nr:DUF3179 domain-containing protein [Alphaproteobacteria bacterium]
MSKIVSNWRLFGAAALLLATIVLAGGATAEVDARWKREFPKADFSKHSVDLGEIFSGGPPRDGIPAIDKPAFVTAKEAASKGLPDREAVIAVAINGDVRAYPLRILMWHEIVNDTVGGVPVAVTFCPLCNSAVVFDRRLDGVTLDFGTTGRLRNSDLVMYDRQTESWWQQFLGEAIVGTLTGKRLKILPVRVESFAKFKARAATGKKVLVPNDPSARRYGHNPYARYDSRSRPYAFFRGKMPTGIAPLERVVVVGKQAWALSLIKAKKKIVSGDLVITWESGQASALDTTVIARGKDVGNVAVQRRSNKGLVDAVHDISFAFAFHAFHPKGKIHTLN